MTLHRIFDEEVVEDRSCKIRIELGDVMGLYRKDFGVLRFVSMITSQERPKRDRSIQLGVFDVEMSYVF
jgi:hypothetical protein